MGKQHTEVQALKLHPRGRPSKGPGMPAQDNGQPNSHSSIAAFCMCCDSPYCNLHAVSVLVLGLQKQKKPAAASQNVGAILGEAADVVVGKYANSSGPNSSPYLNRLSEIQIQDEAYSHQQLVKEEGKQALQDRYHAIIQHAHICCRSSRGKVGCAH